VATLPVAAGAQVFYAQDMGFFKDAGLEVDIHPNENSRKIAEAVASNAVDIGHVNLVSVAAHHKTAPLVVLAPAGLYTSKAPTTALVVDGKSAIREAKDLNGKTIGTQGLGTINEYSARAWINKNGGDASSVKFVEMKFADKPKALTDGHVDATVLTEPYLDLAKKNGARVLGYPFEAIAKEFPVNAWATTPRWDEDHSDLAKRFAGVMRQTAIWANKNRTKSGEVLAKYTGVDPPAATVLYAEQLTASMIQPQIDVLAEYGNFSKFPAAELLEPGSS
jgi:NitT/TauT family transport system substrate-binding protein